VLILIIGLYFTGIGFLLNGAENMNTSGVLFWNRFYFYAVTGAILIGVYVWTNFKPRGLSTQQYVYQPWESEDIPDNMRGVLTWGKGRMVNKSTLGEVEEPSEPTMEYWEKKSEEYREKKKSDTIG
jgi:hypothetical protein